MKEHTSTHDLLRGFGWMIPVFLVLIVFMPARWGSLVWDDGIIQYQQLSAFRDLKSLFFPRADIPQWPGSYYRPVLVGTYILDNWIYGPGNVAGFHLTNLLLHLAVTLWVYLLARRCFRGTAHGLAGALAAAAVFGVHPIHTESVSWISGRTDTVAAFFMLPAVLCALHYRDRGRIRALVSGPCLFLLAVLSKEVSMATLPLLPLLLWLVPGSRGPAPAIRDKSNPLIAAGIAGTGPNRPGRLGWGTFCLLYALATAAYFALRSGAGVAYGGALEAYPFELAVRFIRAGAYYLWMGIVPYPQSHFVQFGMLPSAGLSLLALGGGGGAVGICLYYFRKGSPLARALLTGAGWFGVTLLPSLYVAVTVLSENPVAERYLYVPSVGVCLVLGAFFSRGLVSPGLRKPVLAATLAVLVAYGGLTVARGIVWNDNARLWSDALETESGYGLPWLQLGNTHLRERRFEAALDCYRKSLAAKYDGEGRAIAHYNIAIVHMMKNEPEAAETRFRKALAIDAGYAAPCFGLAEIARSRALKAESPSEKQRRLTTAAELYRQAVRRNPNYAKALWGLGRCRAIQGHLCENRTEMDQALAHYRAAVGTFEALTRVDGDYITGDPRRSRLLRKFLAHVRDLENRAGEEEAP